MCISNDLQKMAIQAKRDLQIKISFLSSYRLLMLLPIAGLAVLDDVPVDGGDDAALYLDLLRLDVVTPGLSHVRIVDRDLGLSGRRAVVLELRVRRDLRRRILLALLRRRRRLLVRGDLRRAKAALII